MKWEVRTIGRRRRTKRVPLSWLVLLPLGVISVLWTTWGRMRVSTTMEDFHRTKSSRGRRCVDKLEECSSAAEHGGCDANASFMYRECPASCGACNASYTISRFVRLPGGLSMPSIGLGTAGLAETTGEVVELALSLGYRKIDSAQAREWYREDLVGQSLKGSNIPRDELFLTTKVHPRDLGLNATRAAVQRSLVDLGVSYLDLVLLHYPECWGDLCGGATPEGTWQDAWSVLEDLITQGLVRCAGVSNFRIEQLVQLVHSSKVPPCLVQCNSEPLRPNAALQAFCRAHNINFEGYSTLGGQYWNAADGKNPVLTNSIALEVAKAKGRSSAEVVLRWALQSQQTVVPRSSRGDHLLQNLKVFEFDLTDGEMEALDALGAAHYG